MSSRSVSLPSDTYPSGASYPMTPGRVRVSFAGEVSRVTRDEAARLLDGREYLDEVPDPLHRQLREAGLVAVFGGSDDLVYFAGAISDERGARDGTLFHVDAKGLILDDPSDPDWHDREPRLSLAGVIRSLWWRDRISWSYETTIPHATFTILEDDEIYCWGLVFALSDAGSRRSADLPERP
jgi:hypothetical protein